MITLRVNVEVRADGLVTIVYNWILQSKHHFIIRRISQENYYRLLNRYSMRKTKNILDPEIVSKGRDGDVFVILETEFS